MTKIVNLYKEKYDVYIGRPGKNQNGYFGNPVKLDKINKCFICNEIHEVSGSTLKCYKIYFLHRIETDIEFKEKILELKNKTLGCFCNKPENCHGNIIKEWIDNQ